MKNKIIVILGPTASGKSDIAVQIAKKFKGEIISADSRQVYKGLDIGTGKITKKEMKGVPHHMLDVASPKAPPRNKGKNYSVDQFKKEAEKVIETILKQKKLPIICGGSGFYIQALVDGVVLPEVKPDPTLRKQLEKKSAPDLFKILQKLDPERARTIDRNNPRRLVRAIEIAKALGGVPKKVNTNSKFDSLKIGIKIPDGELRERIDERLKLRIKNGMINEAKRLHASGLSFGRMRELGLEYRQLADFVENKIDKTELTSLLKKEIWQYAKRQKTWFKKDKEIIWLEPKLQIIEKEIRNFLR